MIPIIEGQSKNLNLFPVSYCRIKIYAETFLICQFCTSRFSVPSLNLKTDRNLEIGTQAGPLAKKQCTQCTDSCDHFAELKEIQKPQPGPAGRDQTSSHGSQVGLERLTPSSDPPARSVAAAALTTTESRGRTR